MFLLYSKAIDTQTMLIMVMSGSPIKLSESAGSMSRPFTYSITYRLAGDPDQHL